MAASVNRSVVALAALALSACASLPPSPISGITAPAQWRESAGLEAETADIAAWWTRFGDPVLIQLVQEARAANVDLRLAAARMREAKALAVIADAALWPSIDLAASAGRSKSLVFPAGIVNRAQAGFDANWEIDLFGGNTLESAAAQASAHAAEELRRDVLVAVSAQMARAYLELRGLQRQLAILEQNVAIQRDSLHLAEVRHRAGIAAELDAVRAKTLLETTEAGRGPLRESISNRLDRIAVLSGRAPASVDARLAQARPLPPVPSAIPDLLPSDLLQRRPDLRRAVAEVQAAAAQREAATTDLLPKFFLSTGAARQGIELAGLPRLTGSVFSIGVAAAMPLFNAGRIRANIDVQDARLQQALAAYDRMLLDALSEVEGSLSAVANTRDRQARLSQAVASAKDSVTLSRELYKGGLTDFLSVLDAQRALLAAEDELARADTAAAVSLVSLYKALGGGWDANEPEGGKS